MTLILIILIILVVIYFYYRKRKLNLDSSFTGSGSATNADLTEFNQVKQANQTLITFLRTNLNSNSLEELKTKLNDKTLNEILEENEDYETEIDNLTRTKNSLEADLLAQSNAFQARVKEKEREIKKAKEDLAEEKKRCQNSQQSLTSEKQQHKGSLERITKLTEQITNLEQEKKQIKQQHTEQLRAINLLFDASAKDYAEIDFHGLYELLRKISQKDLPGSFPGGKMTKQQIAQQLKQEFAKGNLKPSQLKRSKSASDLPKSIQATETRRKSLEVLTNPNSLKVQLAEAHDQISILELKLETSQRELSELNSLAEENNHLKEQAEIKQQQMESLRKTLAETNAKLISGQKDLERSLVARHQGLKDFGVEYEKRKLAQQELNSAVEESSEELISQDQLLTKLRSENFKLKQTNSQLSRDLNLSSRLAEMRKVPYFENEFNGLNYFKYAVYALLAVWFLVMLRKSKGFTPRFPERRNNG